MSTTPNNDTEPKGFSGLSSLVSDISKDIANANQCPNCGYVSEDCGQKCQKCGIVFAKYKASFVVTRTPPQTQQESASNSSNITTSSVEKNDKTQDLKAWADSIIAEARGQGEKGAKAEVEKKTATNEEDNKTGDIKPKSKTSEKTSSRISPPTDSGNNTRLKWLFAIGCVIAVLWFMSQPGNENKIPRTSTPPNSTSTSSIAARHREDKPPVGRNHILSYAQIRYCLSEKIRLDAMENLINNSEVDRFNSYVNDYNSRCGKARYRQGSLQGVRKKVEADRRRIAREGKQRVEAWR